MVDLTAGVAEFKVGRVMSRSFSTFFRNFASFGLLALVISAPTYVYTILTGSGEAPGAAEDLPIFWASLDGQPFAVFVVRFLLGYLIVAALTYGTIQDLRDDRASPGECFSRGVALMLPVLGVAIVSILIMALFLVITVVPGIFVVGSLAMRDGSAVVSIVLTAALFIPFLYVWIMLWVTLPVAVVERRGFGSLARSTALTKGCRWRIFFLLLLLLVVGIGVGLLLGVVSGAISATASVGGGGGGSAYFAGQVAIEWIVSAFVSALSAVIVAVSYHDLRVAKEGADTSQIAAVFD